MSNFCDLFFKADGDEILSKREEIGLKLNLKFSSFGKTFCNDVMERRMIVNGLWALLIGCMRETLLP